MSASSDGSNPRTSTKLEPICPRSSHAQAAFDQCLKQQATLAEKAAVERERAAATERAAACTGGDAKQKPTARTKVTPSASSSSSSTSCYETQRRVDGKKGGWKTKDGHKSRSRSGRRRRRHDVFLVNTSKSKTSAEVLRISLNELGWRWKEYTGNQRVPCDLFWNGISFFDCESKPLGGMVNKFPGLLELVRKARLSKLLHQMRQLFPEEYGFYPRTWILPEQYHLFCAEVATFTQKNPGAKPVFIVKPDDGCQGDGIYLISNPHHVSSTGLVRPAVVQEYVPRPLLLERLKFDLRVYALLASLDPLQVCVCREGMARFCTVPYRAPAARNLHVSYMHLTNYSLNKGSRGFVHTDATDRGSKRTMSSVFRLLAERGLDVSRVWAGIQEMVVKTIAAMLPDLRVAWAVELPPRRSNPSCFQILGFDVLLTDELKPILLEVNANPSMRLDFENHLPSGLVELLPSPVDEEIKIPLVTDILRLLRPGKSSKVPRSDSSVKAAKRNQIPVVGLDEEQGDEGAEAKNATYDEGGEGEEPKDTLYDSCLEEIWPRKFGHEFGHLRIMERVAALFNHFLGVRGAHRLGATGFRTFCRKCKLCSSGFSTAAADIMYIDVARRWNERNCEGAAAGMCFGAFLEAFFALARRRMQGDTLRDRVLDLVEHCELNLHDAPDRPRSGGKRPQQQQQQRSRRLIVRPPMAARTLSRKDNSEN